MAHTVQRLTLYALISALERDLRDFLSLHVGPLVTPDKLLSEPLRQKAQERYEKDNSESDPADVDELLDYLDLADEIQAIRAHEKKLDGVTQTYIKKYYLGLEGVIPIRNRVMHSRPLEFDDFTRVSDLAAELVRSHRSLWANLRTARKELDRDPDFFASLTIPDSVDENTKVLHNLPQAEFDDTGFVARDRELNDLRRALGGSYPVVTVVGEGGLGKTSLALKACYDLLDDPDAKLDAIVWTTAKATRLTLSEIEVIDGAISTSLGIIESAASLLGRQNESAAIEDLLAHLTNNKILLVIDNLETVIDQNIRNLVRQVPQGSKILFTTRVGLGAFDFPIPLSPLNGKDSAFYFRRTARVWGVSDMATASNAVVDGYCDKLQHNPLFIKWFIQSVRAGKRPTVLTSDPKELLQFCLQNVFNSLSADAKRVASTLASVNGSQTVASLAFFTELDSIGIQSALSILITSNLVSAERGRSSEDEDRYTLSALARLYIQRFIRPKIDEQKRLLRKQNELRSAQEEFSARAGADLFDMRNVFVREKDDYIVAKILTKAIEKIFGREWDGAEAEIVKAADLSPNYFELHRVRAMLQDAGDDVIGAEASYETAISLAPERAPLRLWFGQFLSKKLGDQDRALQQLLKAEALAPQSAHVKLECARVLQYHRQFDEAQKRLEQVDNVDKLSARTRRVHLDLMLQNLLRSAEHHTSMEEYNSALEYFERARELISGSPSQLVDHVTIRHIGRAKRHFLSLKRAFIGCPEESRVIAIEDWIAEPVKIQLTRDEDVEAITSEGSAPRENPANLPPNRGRLVQIHQNYAFIDTGGARFFFHRGNWSGLLDFTSLKDGSIVEFEIGPDDGKGPTASRVRPIEDMPANPNQRRPSKGAIKSLTRSFGFIKLDSGGDIFFHRTNCTATTRFRTLEVGDRVRFIEARNQDGRTVAINVECYSGL
jgi:cold shock CspA family protein/Tfp pilus assembly protein PilF